VANPRSFVVDPCLVQVLHVFNRCVRRGFLFGIDSVSGRDYSHRKAWFRQRLEFLTGIFAFDIATYAVMSNHFHLVVRSRPDIVASWTDEEVAIRILRLQGKAWFRRDGTLRKSAAAEIERIVGNPDEIQRLRRKLSDLSSLMSYFDRNLATRANQEDEVTGAFWEGTYRAELINDETSLLACMAYVDLNPIRAMLAPSLEESDYTGAFDRIGELRSQLATGEFSDDSEPDVAQTADAVAPDAVAPDAETPADSCDNHPSSRKASTLDWATLNWERENQPTIGWLAPIELDERRGGLDIDRSGRRPSCRGFLPISLAKYLQIVDWAGRQVRPDKRGAIPEDVPPILARLGIDSEAFVL
jgi:REP element-mobilizing transposase RayT